MVGEFCGVEVRKHGIVCGPCGMQRVDWIPSRLKEVYLQPNIQPKTNPLLVPRVEFYPAKRCIFLSVSDFKKFYAYLKPH